MTDAIIVDPPRVTLGEWAAIYAGASAQLAPSAAPRVAAGAAAL